MINKYERESYFVWLLMMSNEKMIDLKHFVTFFHKNILLQNISFYSYPN